MSTIPKSPFFITSRIIRPARVAEVIDEEITFINKEFDILPGEFVKMLFQVIFGICVKKFCQKKEKSDVFNDFVQQRHLLENIGTNENISSIFYLKFHGLSFVKHKTKFNMAAAMQRNPQKFQEDLTNVEFETSEDVEVLPTFNTMGLREELLRGIYAYGKFLT